jgi:hypothetical protein
MAISTRPQGRPCRRFMAQRTVPGPLAGAPQSVCRQGWKTFVLIAVHVSAHTLAMRASLCPESLPWLLLLRWPHHPVLVHPAITSALHPWRGREAWFFFGFSLWFFFRGSFGWMFSFASEEVMYRVATNLREGGEYEGLTVFYYGAFF